MSETLKPCPFCGGSGTMRKRREVYGTFCCAECSECGAMTRGVYSMDDERAESSAAKIWNRRAERTCRMEAFLLGEFFTGRKHVTDTELSDEEIEKVLIELRDDTRIRCSACNVLVLDGADVTYTQTDDGAWSVDAGMPLINYCPSCGARVERIGE